MLSHFDTDSLATTVKPQYIDLKIIDFNQHVMNHEEKILELYKGRNESDPDKWEHTVIQKDAKYLILLWSTLGEAKSPHNTTLNTRKSLSEYRNYIGLENYYRYEIPPKCPYWRFNYR